MGKSDLWEKMQGKLPEVTNKDLQNRKAVQKLIDKCNKAGEKLVKAEPVTDSEKSHCAAFYAARSGLYKQLGQKEKAGWDLEKSQQYNVKQNLLREDSGSGSHSSDTPSSDTPTSSPNENKIPLPTAGSGNELVKGKFVAKEEAKKQEEPELSNEQKAALERIRARNKKIDALEVSAAQHGAEAIIHGANAAYLEFQGHAAMFDNVVAASKGGRGGKN